MTKIKNLDETFQFRIDNKFIKEVNILKSHWNLSSRAKVIREAVSLASNNFIYFDKQVAIQNLKRKIKQLSDIHESQITFIEELKIENKDYRELLTELKGFIDSALNH